jgi:uncharacterized protein (DUF362 family)
MMPVLVSPIQSYSELSDMRRFVWEALRLDPRVLEILRRPTPSPLIVVKPNWVQQAHEYRPDLWEPVITHPALVEAVAEVLAEAMGGRGTIAICDAPNTYADFAAIVGRGDLPSRLEAIRTRWPSLKIEVIDLRREVWQVADGVVLDRRPNPPDPRGYVALDLGRDSLFYGFRGEGRYYGADYDVGVVNDHHHGSVHEYLLAGTAMRCDLFVNLPKLKTHKKTGITCSLKNLVGINGEKNWLPHHTEGVPNDGGDEFPQVSLAQGLESRLKRLGRKVALEFPGAGPWLFGQARRAGKQLLGDSQVTIRNGDWRGNDTCWRMALDLNRALFHGNPDGSWRVGEPKAYLSIVDGIVGGDGNGPLCPDPVASGVLVAGTNPATVDTVACQLMGFHLQDLPLVREAFSPHRWRIGDGDPASTVVVDTKSGVASSLKELRPLGPGFRPHFGWAGLSRVSLPDVS